MHQSTSEQSPHHEKLSIAIFASRNGSSIRKALEDNEIKEFVRPAVIITNNPDAPILNYATEHNIPAYVISRTQEGSQEAADRKIATALRKHGAVLGVFSGYARPATEELIDAFFLVNIHPALDERFEGKGMYGIAPFETALAAGVQESGAKLHRVRRGIDKGEVYFTRRVAIDPSETPETLRTKIQAVEPELYKEFFEALRTGNILLE